jgi:hypothetical protein
MHVTGLYRAVGVLVGAPTSFDAGRGASML